MDNVSANVSTSPPPAAEWKFQQILTGKPQEELTEGDLISAVEFDETGNYLAFGNKGGKVTIFQRKHNEEFQFLTDFQSHEPEFDYLKSLEIEEKINKIKFHKNRHNSQFLLTTNDKTIKLWKVTEKKVKNVWKPSNVQNNNGFTSHQSPPLIPLSVLRQERYMRTHTPTILIQFLLTPTERPFSLLMTSESICGIFR
eukprot:TRINITY_DN3101_c0_g1_i2.p1 TRINITY_DN3101_c0_g1~~TRINITY_DN3101_c0_g1_i2.p1  ORF type:complete len:198 (-),score=22.07 TRINITY_DN3101_c0_g1_i2:1123-1716(-)